ncbi:MULTISPECIES: hypothetical protein [Kitasatospora]|uniref:Antitoxin n=2 Tax=Kitasatospora TaxID=2063 RepID=A0ABT1IYJ5_9ACTN|nr:hypothetical protein [Kitasatospora paracochleata]MCP2310224.1 hypothetical protein [Kitasatospora paracochleata]
MGIFDRFRHKSHETAVPADRAALAHDEAADAYSDRTERARQDAETDARMTEQDRQAAEDMTAEGDPWD